MPAEQRLQFVVKAGYLRSSFLFQQRVEVAASSAVHQFHGNLQLRLFDRLEVDELFDLLKIIAARIDGLALERADDTRREKPLRIDELLHPRLDWLRHLRRGGRAIVSREFQSLPLRGIVARGHVDSAERFACANGMGDHGRRCRAFAEQWRQPVRAENFRRGEGEFPAEETRVVAEYNGRLAPMNRRLPVL